MWDDLSAISKNCERCGTTFHPTRKWDARWEQRRFCSPSCRAYARPRDALKRFWAKVEVGSVPEFAPDLDACWLWTASRAPLNGYGSFYFNGRPRPAHIAAYMMFVGPVPDGLELDHLCRVRRCVNPQHLEPVTRRENVRRGFNPAAINARKKHCRRGHEFTEENTRITPSGRRNCRACNREKNRARRRAA